MPSPLLPPAFFPLCDGVTLRVPVVQAPLGSCDGPRLAAEVSRAGGLGCLSFHNPDPGTARIRLRRLRQGTRQPVLVAFPGPFESESILDICAEAGIRHFMAFWWNSPRLIRRIHACGGIAFSQVGTPEQADDALRLGADVLVVQGTEAGGPVRSPYPARDLTAQVLEKTNGAVPVVAGGGLATRDDVAEVLSWGAQAALLGTRFLLSEEARADERHKSLLLRADADRLLLDARLVGDWPCAPRRRLSTPRDEDSPGLFAGSGVGRITEILPAFQIVRGLMP